jgi:heat shock protein HslJ
MDDTTLKPEASATYTLSFDEAGTLLVQADCNRGRGPWRSPNNITLEMGPLAMTRAHCSSRMYDRFVRDLGDVRSYVIKDGRPYLSLQLDAGIYEFAPTDRPATR